MALELGSTQALVSKALCDGLNKGEVVVSDVGPTIPGVSGASLQRFLLEATRAVAAGLLNPDKLCVAIRSSGTTATAEALGSDLSDSLWYAWQEVENDATGDAKSRLADAAKDSLKEQLLTKQQLLECGEGEFFEWCGLVVSKEGWRKKEIRSHTKHVYQQRKFNLLREESEGYAKLATLLNQRAAGCLTQATTAAALEEMKALIGYFDLDPNRCFSVLLDAFSQQPGNDTFLALMPAFSSDALGQLLGFHFSRCREDVAAQRPAQPAPAGLYVAAAKMVRAGLTSLEALMAHLEPTDEEMTSGYKEGAKKMADGIARIGIISLISAADNTAPLAPPGLGLRREPSGALGGAGIAGLAGGGAGMDGGQPRAKSGLTASALELAAAPYAAPLTTPAAGNQKLLLLAALLQIGDWEHAEQLMRWLRCLGLSDFAIFPAVGQALCTLIGRELQPVYAAATASSGPPASAASLALPRRLLELLSVAGQHLYHNVAVLTKLVRVLAAQLAANNGLHPQSKQLHEQALELLTQSVLPAMAMIPGNAGLVNEIWAALHQLPYTDRFCLYADVKEGVRTSPLLTAAAKLAETEVRRILRRVTAPANKKEAKLTMKPLGRMLAKIMHSAPLAVAEQLIRQVMGMPGMVTSIVESLKYLTPMAFDVMTFAVLKQLASPKKKLKDDGVNLEEWYTWLAAFTGLLCKKHTEVEVVALLQYVANQLKSCESLDILVLKEMVATMTGHQAVFEVGEHQLDALAGSDTLKAEAITQGEHRSSDKSLQRASARLLAALQQGETPQEHLAMPLLVLLAQQRKLIVLQSQSTHLKLIAELYDKCQEVCTQYAEFLQHALTTEQYAALLPSMEELANEYSVDPELIFSLYRPLIRGVLPPAALTAGADHEEEGEIAAAEGGGTTGEAAAAAGGAGAPGEAALMEEDGQLEAGEVAATPRAGGAQAGGGSADAAPPPPPPPADAASAEKRWAELEAAVLAMHSGGSSAGEGGERLPFRGMSPVLYTTFWALQLYDLEVPVPRYESTITQLRTDIRIAQGDIESAKRDAQRPPTFGGHGGFGFRAPPPGESHGLTVDVEQLQKDIERSQAALSKLPGELKEQQANAQAVEQRLQREKGVWVLEGAAQRAALPREFVQYCVLPRMLNSPADALYCARFLRKVHQLDVPGFNLLNTINHVMREFGFLVRVCTSREATNFGIFLNECFALVERWRQADVFARECANAHTFRVSSEKPTRKAPAPGTAQAAAPAISGSPAPAPDATGEVAGTDAAAAAEAAPAEAAQDEDATADAGAEEEGTAAAAPASAAAQVAARAPRNVDHREWLNLCHNWQKKLTDEVFSSCLRSRDYMQAKNALLALNRCVKVYPAVKFDASKLIELLKPIRDKDPREDLKTLARMYCTGLEMQMKDRNRNMVSTREEYAGLPPKKRTTRPAAAKGGAATASDGKPAATAGGAVDKAEVAATEKGPEKPSDRAGKEKKAAVEGGAGDKAAPAGGKEDAAAGKEDKARRTSDSSKGPPLPPGMGVSARRAEPPRERERERSQQQQRREERGTTAQDGPPPGFGSADKLKHAGSSTELRRPTEQAAAGERDRRERQPQDRVAGRAARDERPPRPTGAKEEAQKEPSAQKEQQQAQERTKGVTALRPEASAFVPLDVRPSSGSARAADEPPAGERDAKRPRREEPAAGSVSSKERERGAERAERGDRTGEREKERDRSVRGRPTSRDAAATEAAPSGKGGRVAGEQRQRSSKEEVKEAEKPGVLAEAAGRGERQRGEREQRERLSSGAEVGSGKERDKIVTEGRKRGEEDARREAGLPLPAKRKREEVPVGERASSRDADTKERQREQTLDVGERQRSRHTSREPRGGSSSAAAAEKERDRRPEGGRSRRGEQDARAAAGTGEVEDARAAARAAVAAGSDKQQRPREAAPRERERDDSTAGGRAAAAPVEEGRQPLREGRVEGKAEPKAPSVAGTAEAESDGGGSSGSDEERSKGKRHKKKDRKEKKKRDRKDKKHSKKDRSSEREPANRQEPAAVVGVPAAAAGGEEERDIKRSRREEAPDVPARLRGRLGSGLLGAALKEIAHEGSQQQQQQQQPQRTDRRERQLPQQQQGAPLVREGSGRGWRGGREERQAVAAAEEEPPQREVREVRDGRRDGRRGGRSSRR